MGVEGEGKPGQRVGRREGVFVAWLWPGVSMGPGWNFREGRSWALCILEGKLRHSDVKGCSCGPGLRS